MEDSFEKLADIIKENSLGGQALDYLADIKRELKEKEKLHEALNIACKELEDLDSTLYDLYDSLDYYYETKDRHEWKKELLERAEEETDE